MRPPTHLASDVFLRRLLMRTSTSGAAAMPRVSSRPGAPWGSSRARGVRSRSPAPALPMPKALRRHRPADRSRRGRRRRTGSRPAFWPTSETDTCMPAQHPCIGECRMSTISGARQRDRAEREGSYVRALAGGQRRPRCNFGRRLHSHHRLGDRCAVEGVRQGRPPRLGRHHPHLEPLHLAEGHRAAAMVAASLPGGRDRPFRGLDPAPRSRRHHRFGPGQVVRQEHRVRRRAVLAELHLRADPGLRRSPLRRSVCRRASGDLVRASEAGARAGRSSGMPVRGSWRRVLRTTGDPFRLGCSQGESIQRFQRKRGYPFS